MTPEILLLKPSHEYATPLQRDLQSGQRHFPREAQGAPFLARGPGSQVELPVAGSLPFLRWHSGTFMISARPGFPGKFPLGLRPVSSRVSSMRQCALRGDAGGERREEPGFWLPALVLCFASWEGCLRPLTSVSQPQSPRLFSGPGTWAYPPPGVFYVLWLGEGLAQEVSSMGGAGL